MSDSDQLSRASAWISEADAILVTAGAGMGVDSGLPDFRGPEGFWRVYPPYEALGMHFQDLANAQLFDTDPTLAWGFYGHRLQLYRDTLPHDGFTILKAWMDRCDGGGFVFTSNVDGQFQKAGFPDNVMLEVHGSIHHLQHLYGDGAVWPAETVSVEWDETTMRAFEALPRKHGQLLRPNILMFDDYRWSDVRRIAQSLTYSAWKERIKGRRVVVIDIGAGLAIPTVRLESEAVADELEAKLVRINPRDPSVPRGGIALPLNALAGLRMLDQHVNRARA